MRDLPLGAAAPPVAVAGLSRRRSIDKAGSNSSMASCKTKVPGVSGSPAIHTREERIKQFGLDCGNGLEWTNWEPGSEHVKHLVIRNVSSQVVKLRYRLPKTKYFGMDFPETKLLNAGMSFSVPVAFRPIREENYTDHIEFTTTRGKFAVPIMARIKHRSIVMPRGIDFGLCPINEVEERSFTIVNDGELPIEWSLDVHDPIRVQPDAGSLAPGEVQAVTTRFTPRDASARVLQLVCRYGPDPKDVQTMRITGAGKYAYLLLANQSHGNTVDFADVPTDTSVHRELELANRSPVKTSFVIKRAENDMDSPFQVSPKCGVVPAHGSICLRVTYSPSSSGTHSEDTYVVMTPGGNEVRIRVKGSAHGPPFQLSDTAVCFGDVEGGRSATRTLTIYNNGRVPLSYAFQSDRHGVYQIDRPVGQIAARSQAHVNVSFTPTRAINYYKRVYILVQNQHPIYVDLLGTCWIEKRSRPAPFKLKHLHQFQHRTLIGASRFPPERLEMMIQDGTLPATPRDSLLDTLACQARPQHSNETMSVAQSHLLGEWFADAAKSDKSDVALDTRSLEFGLVSMNAPRSEFKDVCVFNNTEGKVTATWHLPQSSTESRPPFVVAPASADIAPGSAETFRIFFHPTASHTYYGHTLDCFVYYKSHRNFRLVTDDTFCAPWCLPLLVSGHTITNNEACIPPVELTKSSIDFPPCLVGDSVYQTVALRNAGETAVKFELVCGSGAHAAEFTAKPDSGMIAPHSLQLVVLRFCPSRQGRCSSLARVMLNNSFSHMLDLRLKGLGAMPQLEFPRNPQHRVYFPPTCVGASSEKTMLLQNASRVPVRFAWRIPAHVASQFQVHPRQGVLRGNEQTHVTWRFTPAAMARLAADVTCVTSAEGALMTPRSRKVTRTAPRTRPSASHTQRTQIKVCGEALAGSLVVETDALEFNTVLIGSEATRDIVLRNISNASVSYRVQVEQQLVVDMPPDTRQGARDAARKASNTSVAAAEAGATGRKQALRVDQPAGSVAALSCKTIKVTFRPADHQLYSFRLLFHVNEAGAAKLTRKILPAGGAALPSPRYPTQAGADADADRELGKVPMQQQTQQQPQDQLLVPHGMAGARSNSMLATAGAVQVCEAIGIGMYPIVQVTDVRSHGTSKAQLWHDLSLSALNQGLAGDLTQAEVAYANMKFIDDSGQGKDLAEYLERFSVFLGSAAFGADAHVVRVRLDNVGPLACDWELVMPHDRDFDEEYWAQDGMQTDEQLLQEHILDNKLFELEPRSGTLPAAGHVVVTLTYKHSDIGKHVLPVILHLKNGKQVLLQLQGRTFGARDAVLQLPAGDRQDFLPVAVGDIQPMQQHVVLRNTSRRPVSYLVRMDQAQLVGSTTEDVGVPVFSCVGDPTGVLAPGTVAQVPFVFRPLQAVDYHAKVPVLVKAADAAACVDDDVTLALHLHGTGFLPKQEPQGAAAVREAVPAGQLIPSPGQMVFLSHEHIEYGDVRTMSVTRHVVVMHNQSNEYALAFSWDVEQAAARRSMHITPSSGVLNPGERVLLRVAFHAPTKAQLFAFDLVCVLNKVHVEEPTIEQLHDAVEGTRSPFSGNRATQVSAVPPSPVPLPTTTASHAVTGGGGLSKSASRGMVQRNSKVDLMRATSRSSVTGLHRQLQQRTSGLRSGSPVEKTSSITQLQLQQHTASTNSFAGLLRSDSLATLTSLDSQRARTREAARAAAAKPRNLSDIHISVRACVRAETTIEAAEETRIRPYFVPKADDSVAALPRNTGVDQTILADVMRDLLQDIVYDSSTSAAYHSARTAPTPFFQQLRSEECAQRRRQADHQRWAQRDPAKLAELQRAQKHSQDNEQLARLVQSNEFERSSEAVMEETLYNLMREALAGHFNVLQVPRPVATRVQVKYAPSSDAC